MQEVKITLFNANSRDKSWSSTLLSWYQCLIGHLALPSPPLAAAAEVWSRSCWLSSLLPQPKRWWDNSTLHNRGLSWSLFGPYAMKNWSLFGPYFNDRLQWLKKRPRSLSRGTLDSIVMSAHAFLVFLWHLIFWIGMFKVFRWNGLKILIPKHMWKVKSDLWNRFKLKIAMGHFFWSTL